MMIAMRMDIRHDVKGRRAEQTLLLRRDSQ